MSRLSAWVILPAVLLAACAGGSARRISMSEALRPEVRITGTPQAVEVRTSRPSYIAVVTFESWGERTIAQGGPEPGRHLVPLAPGASVAEGRAGGGWSSEAGDATGPHSGTSCSPTREVAGRDPQGRPTYRTVRTCSYVPLTGVYPRRGVGPEDATRSRRARFVLVLATATPLEGSALRSAVAAVPSTADHARAAALLSSALFADGAAEGSVVVAR